MQIQLARSEIRKLAPDVNWDTLGKDQQKWLAANILRNRPDAQSQLFALRIESNNPNFQNFVVVEDAG